MDAATLLQNTVDRLNGHKSRYAEIARKTGISYSTLTKLAQGHSDNPTIANLQSVIEALDEFERSEGLVPANDPEPPPAPKRIDTPEAVARLLGVAPSPAVSPAAAVPAAPLPDPEPQPEVPGDSVVVPFEAPP